jgi:type I restriction enzyme S subunit
VRQTTGIQNLAVTHYLGINVSLPPLEEQQRIVAYLDDSCEVIDQAVEAKKKQLDTLDTLRKSIITPAILQGLGKDVRFRKTDNPWLAKVPKHWKLVALKRVSVNQSGLTLGKNYDPPVVERPYLRAANVQDGYLDLEKITTIEVPPRAAERHKLQHLDVLMTEGGDLDKLGRGFVWESQIDDCIHQNHVHAIRCDQTKLVPKFLAYVTASQYGRDYFEATGKRTTNLASTNSTKVGLLPVPLPPVDEQRAIVEHVDKELAHAAAIQSNVEKQIETLQAYRKSLIHECVTGKRRITDEDIAGE